MAKDAQTGSQLIHKTMDVLQHLSAEGRSGVRLKDLSESLQINQSTAHRILSALNEHGMVERVPGSARWRLGVALFVLGSTAADSSGFRLVARPSLVRLATTTGESVFLQGRSGSKAVVIDRVSGSYMIESLTQNVGAVMPLGVTAGNIAILATLSVAEAEAVVTDNTPRYRDYGLDPEVVRARISKCREDGYCVTNGTTISGVSAVALAIRNPKGEATASLSVNLATARLPAERTPEIVALLREEVSRIEAQIGS